MKKFIAFVFIFIFSQALVCAGELFVAAGAGYSKPVEEIAALYEQKSGEKVIRSYGNLGQVIEQAKQTGKIDIIIGDKKFITKSAIPTVSEQYLGEGKLLLVFVKGSAFKNPEDLLSTSVKKIAKPDGKKAIYGIAADEYLKKTGLDKKLEDKILVVASVPQGAMYLSKGEVDAAFMNTTQYKALKDNFGNMTEIDKSLYNTISISAVVLKDAKNKEQIDKFMLFLQSDEVKSLLAKHGLER